MIIERPPTRSPEWNEAVALICSTFNVSESTAHIIDHPAYVFVTAYKNQELLAVMFGELDTLNNMTVHCYTKAMGVATNGLRVASEMFRYCFNTLGVAKVTTTVNTDHTIVCDYLTIIGTVLGHQGNQTIFEMTRETVA